MNNILPSNDLYWWGRFHNEFIQDEYNNIYDENGILRPMVVIPNSTLETIGINSSFPRMDIQTVRGELIRIPVIPEPQIPRTLEPSENTHQQSYIALKFESIPIPFLDDDILIIPNPSEVNAYSCSICFQ